MTRLIVRTRLAFKAVLVAMAAIAGIALTTMMLVTCLDIVLRIFGMPIKGAVDLVQILAAITIASSLPYTTACKGHVAIEFFSRQLPKSVQLVVDSAMRLLCIALFLLCAHGCIGYGRRLLASAQVSTTLQAPIFWIPWYISLTFLLTALVICYHLIRPNKALLS